MSADPTPGNPVIVLHEYDSIKSFIQSLRGWVVTFTLSSGTEHPLLVSGAGTDDDGFATVEGHVVDDMFEPVVPKRSLILPWSDIVKVEVW